MKVASENANVAVSTGTRVSRSSLPRRIRSMFTMSALVAVGFLAPASASAQNCSIFRVWDRMWIGSIPCRVTWPVSGLVQELNNIESNQVI